MSVYRWKSFYEDEDRPEKPRFYGVTEIRGPNYSFMNQTVIQDILESMGEFVDGLKFSGGSHSLMPKTFVKEITDMAHKHDVYVSTGDWAEHLLRRGPAAFKQYVEECKHMGFDTIELNVSSLKIPEESLLRFVRMIKSSGLKVKPQFGVKIDASDIPIASDRAFGAYPAALPRKSEIVEDVDLLIRRAERCLEAGADMIMIDADDVCKYADTLRTDIIAKIIGRLGVEKTMFEASNTDTSEWFIRRYGPRVNLFVDHSQVMNIECQRGRNLDWQVIKNSYWDADRNGLVVQTDMPRGSRISSILSCICRDQIGCPVPEVQGSRYPVMHAWDPKPTKLAPSLPWRIVTETPT